MERSTATLLSILGRLYGQLGLKVMNVVQRTDALPAVSFKAFCNTLVGAASLGTVGLDWQLGGFAASSVRSSDSSTSQLVQAMASFDGGSGERGSNKRMKQQHEKWRDPLDNDSLIQAVCGKAARTVLCGGVR